jgi:hypothetical protein
MISIARPIAAATAGLLAMCGFTGCGLVQGVLPEDTHVMSGRLVAPECGGGYELENAQVTLRDESGDIVGTAQTSSNLVDPITEPCVVSFRIPEIEDAKFYTVKVGTHEGPAWSVAELRKQQFQPDLNLGDAELPTDGLNVFCAAADDAQATFEDVDTLNEDFEKWASSLNTDAASLRKAAAAFKLDPHAGEKVVSDATIDVIVQTANALDRFDPDDGYLTTKQLNTRLNPVNDSMQTLYIDVNCSGY